MKNKVSLKAIFKDGVLTSNPLFVSMLGLCPALAITDKVMNAVGMTFAFFFVLLLSNVVISLLRKVIPNEIRIPIYIIIVATFVTCVALLMEISILLPVFTKDVICVCISINSSAGIIFSTCVPLYKYSVAPNVRFSTPSSLYTR